MAAVNSGTPRERQRALAVRRSSVDSMTPARDRRATSAAITTSTGQAADPQARMWPWVLIVSAVVVATGMAYSLLWAPVVHHQSYWLTPGDIWYSVRTAHWIGWGSLSFVYSNTRSELVTLPGFEVLLTPFVLLSSALGLSETAPGLFPNIHPQAWLLIGPLTLASVALGLGAFESLARHMEIALRTRRLLIVLAAIALWPAVALWGHPEDVLAVGLLVLALTKALKGGDTAAGWLLGGAIAMQLFSVLAIPVLLGLVGLRRGGQLLARASILPGFLFIAVAVPNFHDAVWTLFQQPAFPLANHVTPWVKLAPKLAPNVVAGGPARSLGLICAVLTGVLARARRDHPASLVWLMAVALGARCIFDPVMVPYYVMPVVALSLVAAAGNGHLRFMFTIAAGAALTVTVFSHHDMWTYWSMMTAIMSGMLGLAWPRANRMSENGLDRADGAEWMASVPSVRIPAGAR
jgi:hypothetical protein